MLELEQLIRKFWAGETAPEEDRHLFRLLQEYKESYKDTVQKEFFAATEQELIAMDPDKASGLLKKIHHRLRIEGLEERQYAKTVSFRRLYKGLAVAASVGVLVVAVFLLSRPHRSEAPVAATRTASPKSTEDSRSSDLVHWVGNTDSIRTLTLEDGSTVQLTKNSVLSFHKPFINDRRDLYLQGEAVFNVAKDKTRPFVVYAGGIATKVLGTRFSVNAVDVRKVKVRLLEGKVAITAAAGSGLTMNDVVLKPGEELAFDKDRRSYTVNAISPQPERTSVAASSDKRPEMVFNKEPLGKVFQKIGVLYNIPLTFRQEELQGLYFTGTFLKSDDLHIVLSAICNVNSLAFTEEKDTIIITRSH